MIVWWFLILFNMFLICCTVIVCAVQSQNADAQWFRMPPDPTCQACPGRCRSCTAAEHLRSLRRVRWVLRLSKSAGPWWKPQINWFLVCFSCFSRLSKSEVKTSDTLWHTSIGESSSWCSAMVIRSNASSTKFQQSGRMVQNLARTRTIHTNKSSPVCPKCVGQRMSIYWFLWKGSTHDRGICVCV